MISGGPQAATVKKLCPATRARQHENVAGRKKLFRKSLLAENDLVRVQ
jgi:hypothetical protein